MTTDRRTRIHAELPFPADLPRIGHAGLGLGNLVARAGGGQELLVTLLDTADHRLLRAGGLLAHRISQGEGDWYLVLPPWCDQPDRTVPLDEDGDLPAAFQEAVAPFRRLATLGPIAALTVERQDYLVRTVAEGDRSVDQPTDPTAAYGAVAQADPGQHEPGQHEPGQHEPGQQDPGQHEPGQEDPGQHEPGQQGPGQQQEPGPVPPEAPSGAAPAPSGAGQPGGTVLGTVRDQRVTVRRGGMTMARYREVTVTLPHGDADDPVPGWISEALMLAGATIVADFPTLAQRLGAPATGPTDFPDPDEVDPHDLPGLVARWIAAGLRGHVIDPAGGAADELAARLAAVGPALDPGWVDDLVTDLRWLARIGPNALRHHDDAERALALIEALVQGVRAPRVAEDWPPDAEAAVARLQRAARDAVRTGREELAPDAADEVWLAAADRAAHAANLAHVLSADRLGGKPGRNRKRAKRYRKLHDQLQRCVDAGADRLRAEAAAAPERAFELGMDYQRRRSRVARQRRSVLRDWGDILAKAEK